MDAIVLDFENVVAPFVDHVQTVKVQVTNRFSIVSFVAHRLIFVGDWLLGNSHVLGLVVTISSMEVPFIVSGTEVHEAIGLVKVGVLRS